MASHPTQDHQKMQINMHQHYSDNNGAKHRNINSDQLLRYIAYRYYRSALLSTNEKFILKKFPHHNIFLHTTLKVLIYLISH